MLPVLLVLTKCVSQTSGLTNIPLLSLAAQTPGSTVEKSWMAFNHVMKEDGPQLLEA